MTATRLFKNAGLYSGTHNRWDPTTHQIVTTDSEGATLVHNTLSQQDAVALRDGLLKAFPLATTVPASSTPAQPAPIRPAPAPAPTAAPATPTAPTSRTLLGINAAPDWPAAIRAGIAAVAPKIARLDSSRMSLGSAETAQAIQMVRAAGAEPLLLWSDWQPSTTPQTIRQWVDKFSIKQVEIGNEDFYNYAGKSTTASIAASTAHAYAVQVKAIHTALQGSGCKLLAQFDFPHWNGVEVTAIHAAVPDFVNYVDGITIHPYVNDVARIATMLQRWNAIGGSTTVPVWATEWGLASDDGRALTPKEWKTLPDGTRVGTVYGYPNDLTYAQAAALVKPAFDRMRAACNLATFVVYQDRDQSAHGASIDPEHYFGVNMLTNGSPGPAKQPYADAVKALGA